MVVSAEARGSAALPAIVAKSTRLAAITVESPLAGAVLLRAACPDVSAMIGIVFAVSAVVVFHSAATADVSVAVVSPSVHVVSYAARAAVSVIIIAVIKRVAVGDISVVVVNDGATAPIGSPIVPSPSVPAVKTDSEADSE